MNWPFLNVVGIFSLMELFVISESFGTMPSQPPRDVVVLIHGLGRGPLSMKRLEGELNKSGYQVVNLSYPSRKLSVEEICDRYLEPLLTAELSGATGKVHFVTHSPAIL